MANAIGLTGQTPIPAGLPQIQAFPAAGTNLGPAAAMPSLPGAPYPPAQAPGATFPGGNSMASVPAVDPSRIDPRYTLSSDNNIITATDSQTGDAIAYARQTKSFLVHSGDSGVTIYGYGNGAYGMQNGNQDISLAVSANGDSVLSDHGKNEALGKITNPHVLSALAQLFGGKAANDLAVAIATKNLERTSVGAAFPIPVVTSLVRVQGQDNREMVSHNLPPALAQNLAQKQAALQQQRITQQQNSIMNFGNSALANAVPDPSDTSDDSSNSPDGDSSNPYAGDTNPNPYGDPSNANPYTSSANPYAGSN